jgi:hypothetical protein
MARKLQTKYRVRRRLFLNLDAEFPAYVIGIVEDTSPIPDDDPKQSWQWGEIALNFGDCYHRVAFDFQMGTRRERANSLRKIRRIAEVVNAVRDAVEAEAASLDARPVTKSTHDD